MTAIAFLGHGDDSDVVAWHDGRPVAAAAFRSDVAALCAALPDRGFLLNLCADRYRFAVGFAAALQRQQVSLLPPAHTPAMLEQLKQQYAGMYALCDDDGVQTDLVETVHYAAVPRDDVAATVALSFPPGQLAAIAFTSGSTGEPTPHTKTWAGLALGATHEAQCLKLGPGDTLVGTVPPQHMYGLESSVLMALRNGLALHTARPFYPADIRAILEQIPERRVLVTTPVHLRALLAEERTLPALRLILCATAPLPLDMAAAAEARYSAPVHEIFGFTEAGMVATRRTTQGPQWHALPGVRLWREGAGVQVAGGHIPGCVRFSDLIELEDAHTFQLVGRNADLVNIAGKRSSIAYLNQQLLAIAGVEDGVFFLPDGLRQSITRLIAFVVAPDLSRDALLSALRARIDPAFLPRPLYYVDSLPRAATGKLAREALVQLAQSCSQRERDQ